MIVIIILFASMLHGFNVNYEYFQQLKAEHKIIDNQLILLYFIDSYSCAECLAPQNFSLDCICKYLKKNKLERKVKILALIRVDRKIELKSTLNKFGWKGDFDIDDGTVKSKLGIKNNVLISLISSKGDKILTYTISDRKSFCDELIKKIEGIFLIK
jgi:hypothetical protein